MSVVRDFLNYLEERESRLLTWGVVDGAFSPDEVVELAEDFLVRQGEVIDPRELIATLVDQRLLHSFVIGGRKAMRTRMAESVRLLARLRQLFPKQSWRSATTLVSDFRFDLRPRVYPRRDIRVDALLSSLSADGVALTDLQQAALRMLTVHRGEEHSLAGYQVRAIARVLKDLRERRSRGMIVGAGTGTGKTLSFYLPVLGSLAGLVRRDSFWTKALAIYPRNELLKDQFSDTFIQARKLDEALNNAGERTLTIGAYFGPTPKTAAEGDVKRSWPRSGPTYICPFLRCPRCSGTLGWHVSDIRTKTERLQCIDSQCRAVVDRNEVILTRERMSREPPDIVFTTTEMLNIKMTDSASRHVFGVGADRPPRVVLLDEVHTYSGVHGAQVAYVLRRWRKAIGSRAVQFTGLSATLPNAAEFFAQLVGLPPDAVESVEPLAEEMTREGMEYQIILRGDPASGTALLSTTIQSVMLLRRALDVTAGDPTDGMFGSRVFVFTDDLDVANRLYHNLLDAEGRTGVGHVKYGTQPLAALRAHRALPVYGEADAGERLLAGQSWYLAEQIGHPLSPAKPLQIGRTTSQDIGVDQGLDVVVATASLEVGYNDPDVGAVIQHKAPRDIASFLQRKGRAGRNRRMRPWTLTVLSDYGRDRVAYQSYDQLFDPSVERRTLPVGNRHVLRMQAAFAFMDWISLRVPRPLPEGSVWEDFSAPAHPDNVAQQRRQAWEADVIGELLENPDGEFASSLAEYLGAALQVSSDDVRALFWEPPRALMTGVLPTLLRRIKYRWGYSRQTPAGEAGREPYRRHRPLPEFVPENLFSDLNLPEVTIVTPAQRPGGDPDVWTMPIIQAMRTLAPGRVSRRFAPFKSNISHWVPLPILGPGKHAQLFSEFCPEYEELGPFQAEWQGKILDVPCYRPWMINPAKVPSQVGVTSNAQIVWRSQLSPSDAGEELDVPHGGGWDEIIAGVRFHVHALHSHVQVRRFAVGSDASVRLRSGAGFNAEVRFVDKDGRHAGVGFVQPSDGLVFLVRVPAELRIADAGQDSEKLRAFRTAFFRHRVLTDAPLNGKANSFQRERLVQLYLSAVAERALRSECDLPAAVAALADEGLEGSLSRVLDVIFQTITVSDAAVDDGQGINIAAEIPDDEGEAMDSEDGITGDSLQRQRVHKTLMSLCSDPDVKACFERHASVLWSDPDASWEDWAVDRFKATLGSALLEACYRMCPHAAQGDLLLDLDAGPRPPDAPPMPDGVAEIWITESTIGGGGLAEELLRQYAADPRRFFLLARSALGPSDFEAVDAELTRLLEMLASDHDLQSVVANVRKADGHQQLQNAVEELKAALVSRGVLTIHPVMSAIHTRILRPASSPATDALLRDVINLWRTKEKELGIEIDGRVFAYVASATPSLDSALAHVGVASLSDPLWRFDVIYSLLWPRGGVVRSRALSTYNPFAAMPEADRLIVLDVLQAREKHIRLGAEGWREQFAAAMATTGVAHLYAGLSEQHLLREALLELVGTPLDVDFLHLYPQVEGVERTGDRVSARLHLREVVP